MTFSFYKIYSRLDSIALPKPAFKSSSFVDLVHKRKSVRNYSGKPVSAFDLSYILYHSAAVTSKIDAAKSEVYRRPYPSGGARYPLELYPLVLRGTDRIPRGVYHYSPLFHSLDIIERQIRLKDLKPLWKTQSFVKKASVVVIITAEYARTTSKYGEYGVKLILIEAGHLGQNIYMTSEQRGVACCAVGILEEKFVSQLLDIKPEKEIPVYSMVLGK